MSFAYLSLLATIATTFVNAQSGSNITYSISSLESSSIEPISSFIISASSASASESSSIISSSESSSSSESALPTPVISGDIKNGLPQWNIQIPGSLGPWDELAISLFKEGPFNYTNAQLTVDGEYLEAAQTVVTNTTIDVTYSETIALSSVANLAFGGIFTSEGKAVVKGVITITTPDFKLSKRAVENYPVEFTIESNDDTIIDGAESSSVSSSASESSSESSSVSGLPIATSESVSNSTVASTSSATSTTATSTVKQEGTTVITTTSCSDQICSDVTVTTGVTLITGTIDGELTTYLTLIPLTDAPKSTATVKVPETTVVTVTSCDGNKCSTKAVTTGLTVVTSTVKGVVTEYTTYCPLSTTTTAAAPKTTVLTVTSCKENKCSKSEVTTGLTVITKTLHGVVTEYTTYCPLSTTTSSAKPVPTTTSSTTPKPPVITSTTTTVKPGATTVITTTKCKDNVCTKHEYTTGIVIHTSTISGSVHEYTTYLPYSEPTTVITKTSSHIITLNETTLSVKPTAATTSAVTVSTFHGAANSLVAGSSLAAAFLFSLMLI